MGDMIEAFDGQEVEVRDGISILVSVQPHLNGVLIIGDGVQTSYGLIRQAQQIDSVVEDENNNPYTVSFKLAGDDGYYILFDRAIPLRKRIRVYYRPL
jgi:hypothetical protein